MLTISARPLIANHREKLDVPIPEAKWASSTLLIAFDWA